jgi:hypothetical protein
LPKEWKEQRHIVSLTIANCLLYLIYVFGDSGWSPIIVPLAVQLHLPPATIGLFYTAWSTGYLPGVLLGGAWLDRYGPRHAFLGAAIVILIGFLAIYFSLYLNIVLFPALLIIAGITGIAGGTISTSGNGLMSDLFAEQRGFALTLFNLLYPLGGAIITLIDAILLAFFHDNPLPSLLFFIVFITAVMLTLPLVPSTDKFATPSAQPNQKQSLLLLLVSLAPIIAMMALIPSVSTSVRTWMPTYLHIVYRQTPAIAAAFSGTIWMITAITRLGIAALVKRIGTWRTMILGIVIGAGGLMILLISPNALLAMLAAALISLSISPSFALLLAIGSERARKSSGTVTGILLFTSGLSTTFCVWLFGFLLTTAGPIWSLLFCVVFVGGGGLTVLTISLKRARNTTEWSF